MDGRLKVMLFLTALALTGLGFVLLLVWMEHRGWVRLRGGAGRGLAPGLGALDEVYNPPARHVQVVHEQARPDGESGGPPPPGDYSISPRPGGGG